MPEIKKKLDSEVITTLSKKFRQNAKILKSRVFVSVSNIMSRVSVSEFLMKSRSQSRSRNFNQVSVSKVAVSTTSLDCQISFDQKFGNSFDMNKMAARIFVAIFKANKRSTQKFRFLLTESNQNPINENYSCEYNFI